MLQTANIATGGKGRGRGRGRGRRRSRGLGRGRGNGPLCGIGIWNGIGISNMHSFVPLNEPGSSSNAPPPMKMVRTLVYFTKQ